MSGQEKERTGEDEDAPDPTVQVHLEDRFRLTHELLAPYGMAKADDPTVLVVVDTNALLLPYQVGKEDLSRIRDAFKKLALSGQLYAPARVIREFLSQRDRLLGEMIQKLNDAKSRLQPPTYQLPASLNGLDGYDRFGEAVKASRQAKEDFVAAADDLIEIVRGWRGNDPVTAVYYEIFTNDRIAETDEDPGALRDEWETERKRKVFPGYKDGTKHDKGIGDFIIWKTITGLGRAQKKDLIFVTGEQKADWLVRSKGQPIYPKPELVAEYRFHSGKSLRLASLDEILAELGTPAEIVANVRDAEAAANLGSIFNRLKEKEPRASSPLSDIFRSDILSVDIPATSSGFSFYPPVPDRMEIKFVSITKTDDLLIVPPPGVTMRTIFTPLGTDGQPIFEEMLGTPEADAFVSEDSVLLFEGRASKVAIRIAGISRGRRGTPVSASIRISTSLMPDVYPVLP